MPAPDPAKLSAPLWIATACALALHLVSACWNIRHGGLNSDEGFYAVATRAVAGGEMPYRDFGFTQPPLVLYANALPLRAIGFGLFAQRTVNGIWAAGALALAAIWVGRRTRPIWGVALVVGFSLSAPWMYFMHLGKTYGLTTLLVVLGARAFLRICPGPKRNFLLGLLGGLGVATRLPAAPFFGVLWLLALWPGRPPTWREGLAAVLGLVLPAALIGMPLWLAAPEAVKFWVVDFHRLSVPSRNWTVGWSGIATLGPAVWVLTGIALFVALRRRRWLTREAAVMLAAGAALSINLLPVGAYDEYGVAFLLPLAMAAFALVHDELRQHRPALTLGLLGTVAAAQVLTAPLLLAPEQSERRGTASWWLTPKAAPYNPTLPAEVAAARAIVERELAPDAFLIGTNIILAAETGRAVPPELRMGSFSFTLEMPEDRAARLHLTTARHLTAWFNRPEVTVATFFERRALDYGWTMPSFAELPEELHTRWFIPLHRDFVTYQEGDFFVMVRRPGTGTR